MLLIPCLVTDPGLASLALPIEPPHRPAFEPDFSRQAIIFPELWERLPLQVSLPAFVRRLAGGQLSNDKDLLRERIEWVETVLSDPERLANDRAEIEVMRQRLGVIKNRLAYPSTLLMIIDHFRPHEENLTRLRGQAKHLLGELDGWGRALQDVHRRQTASRQSITKGISRLRTMQADFIARGQPSEAEKLDAQIGRHEDRLALLDRELAEPLQRLEHAEEAYRASLVDLRQVRRQVQRNAALTAAIQNRPQALSRAVQEIERRIIFKPATRESERPGQMPEAPRPTIPESLRIRLAGDPRSVRATIKWAKVVLELLDQTAPTGAQFTSADVSRHDGMSNPQSFPIWLAGLREDNKRPRVPFIEFVDFVTAHREEITGSSAERDLAALARAPRISASLHAPPAAKETDA